MVVQGIKDRSEIRKHGVTEKQGCGDESETREAREGKRGKTRRWVSVGRWGDPGEIQGRSIDPGSSVFMGVGGSIGKEMQRVLSQRGGYEGKGEGRTGRGQGRGWDKDGDAWRSPLEV